MTLTVLHSILGYLLSFRSDIIIPCFRKFAINLWFSFLVCMLSKTKKAASYARTAFLIVAGVTRLEHATSGFGDRCSTT